MRATGTVLTLIALAVGLCASAMGAAPVIRSFPAFKSAYIGAIDVSVALPPGYEEGSGRYAVVYMQDGQNLFDGDGKPPPYPADAKWGADTIAAALAEKGAIPPVIIVGVANLGVERMRQYLPQAVFERLPPATQAALVAAIGGKPFSDDYLRFLVTELKPFVDRTFRTLPDRRHTVVMGSSMGGLISLYALTQYPDVFGGAGCLSTHWPLFLDARQQDESRDAVVAAFESYLRDKLPPPDDRRIWFDHGTGTLDAAYPPYQEKVDAVFAGRGWQRGRNLISRTYEGAVHNEASWGARLADPLIFLLGTPPQQFAH